MTSPRGRHHIDAATMVRDGKTMLWTFTRATVVIPDLPAADPSLETVQ